MATKFRATETDFKEYEVVKETDKQVVFLYGSPYRKKTEERREAKNSSYAIWFDTKEEAYNHVKNRLEQLIKTRQSQVESLKTHLKNLEL